jgi:hypothetical protein
MSIERWNEKASCIWSVADLLRGPYRPNRNGDGWLPAAIGDTVLATHADQEERGGEKAVLAVPPEQDGAAEVRDFHQIPLGEVR